MTANNLNHSFSSSDKLTISNNRNRTKQRNSQMKNLTLPILALTLASLSMSTSQQANANSNNLHCNNPFVKVATYNNGIKCKKFRIDLNSKQQAKNKVRRWKQRASCNNHSSPPKSKVWFKVGKWAAEVTFICAIIY